ncbi:MAG: hypothetical protein K0Q58_701 [Microbacterium sp.]|nr:hypothetical protein [Microbacterium sp.]
MGFAIGLGALILLAAAAAIGVFIARRRSEREAAPQRVGRGLFTDEQQAPS